MSGRPWSRARNCARAGTLGVTHGAARSAAGLGIAHPRQVQNRRLVIRGWKEGGGQSDLLRIKYLDFSL